MLQKPGWSRALERWSAFWNGGLEDRPPVIAHIAAGDELNVALPISSVSHGLTPQTTPALSACARRPRGVDARAKRLSWEGSAQACWRWDSGCEGMRTSTAIWLETGLWQRPCVTR